jgi:hypothetical protein
MFSARVLTVILAQARVVEAARKETDEVRAAMEARLAEVQAEGEASARAAAEAQVANITQITAGERG